MAIKRFIKAGFRLLRLKVQQELEHYKILNYPIQESAKDLQYVKFIAISVIFFGEQESDALSKTLEELWNQNPKAEISIITIFSDTKCLNSLHEKHRNQKVTIYNIFCLADASKLKYCLKKNCQIEAAKITQEEYYEKLILQTAKKYQKKHSTQQEEPHPDDAMPIDDNLIGPSEGVNRQ